MVNDLVKVNSYEIAIDSLAFTVEWARQAIDHTTKSENTKKDYKARIPLYIEFINQHGIARNTLLKFRGYLDGRTDYSVSTKNKYFTVAKEYTGILHTLEQIPVDVTKDISGKDIKGFTQDKKHKKDGLTSDDITRLTDYLQSLEASPATARLRALFSLFMLQGLRQIEVVRLDVTDIDLKAGKAFIRGKG
ncbi:MAG: site-specific integrase, partial [Actinobacteria bacterium]|nr:site-specific integrase [Actinomycetota bacterium]